MTPVQIFYVYFFFFLSVQAEDLICKLAKRGSRLMVRMFLFLCSLLGICLLVVDLYFLLSLDIRSFVLILHV